MKYTAYLPVKGKEQKLYAILVDENLMYACKWDSSFTSNEKLYTFSVGDSNNVGKFSNYDKRWTPFKTFTSIEEFKEWYVNYYFEHLL